MLPVVSTAWLRKLAILNTVHEKWSDTSVRHCITGLLPKNRPQRKKNIFCQTDQSKYYTLGTDFSRIEQVVAENHSPNGDRRKRAFELQKARIYFTARPLV